MEVLHKASNLEISYDTETRIMHCKWLGLQNEELIRTSGEIIFNLFKEKGCRKILNDNTLKVGPWYHSVEWTAREWFPRMIEAGLTHFAWIFPEDIFALLSAKRALPDNAVVQAFNGYKDAHEWLIHNSKGSVLNP